MIDIKSLPKDPVSAFKHLLSAIRQMLPSSGQSIHGLSQSNQSLYDKITILLKYARSMVRRIGDDELTELAERNLKLTKSDTCSKARTRIETVLLAINTIEMDDHFLDAEAVKLYDIATVSSDEREAIREHLNIARDRASKAEFLDDGVRRSFLHKVSLAENELYKAKVGFQAFLAAGFEASRLIRRFGEDAQPIADAIEKARTTTERNVEGYKQIGQEEAPRQIEDKSSTESSGRSS